MVVVIAVEKAIFLTSVPEGHAAEDSTATAEAENYFHESIKITRRQKARSLELRAQWTALASLKNREDEETRGRCHNKFTEGSALEICVKQKG